MLADTEEIDTKLVGQRRFIDDVTDHLCVRQHLAVRTACDIAKCIETEFERHEPFP